MFVCSLSAGGGTALGPALLLSISWAASVPGSKVSLIQILNIVTSFHTSSVMTSILNSLLFVCLFVCLYFCFCF